jgi:ADP-heptose:LPS heptosyltransferase
MPPAAFESAISASVRRQTHALARLLELAFKILTPRIFRSKKYRYKKAALTWEGTLKKSQKWWTRHYDVIGFNGKAVFFLCSNFGACRNFTIERHFEKVTRNR